MKPAIDYTKRVLLFHLEDNFKLRELIGINNSPILVSNKVYVYSLTDDDDVNKIGDLVTLDFSFTRYLDKFFFLFSKEKPELRQEIIDVFFEIIAFDYDNLIDIDRNIDNIGFLLSIIKDYKKRDNNLQILDYGCGTGLSSRFANNGIKITGYDRCPIMRTLATKHGLKIIDEDGLLKMEDSYFDAVFASYVFHLLSSKNNLYLLWSKLKYNGILVANFHKGLGTDLIDFFTNDLNAESIKIGYTGRYKTHGEYYGFRKR